MENHVKARSIDFVFSRLVFNHVFIDSTLEKTYDTMVEGGKFWLHVESSHLAFNTLFEEKRIRSKLHVLFAMVNTLVYMTARKQICLKVKGRMHAEHKSVYPSPRSWFKALKRAGFRDVTSQQMTRGYIFIATK
jgi:hypothetical protein